MEAFAENISPVDALGGRLCAGGDLVNLGSDSGPVLIKGTSRSPDCIFLGCLTHVHIFAGLVVDTSDLISCL